MSKDIDVIKKLDGSEPTEIEPMGLDKVNTSTRLLDKNYSPLIVRKYQMKGWPLFVSLICDESLSDLDKVVHEYARPGAYLDDIQWCRNYEDSLCLLCWKPTGGR